MYKARLLAIGTQLKGAEYRNVSEMLAILSQIDSILVPPNLDPLDVARNLIQINRDRAS